MSLNENHTTATCDKKEDNLNGSATLHANLASLLANPDEEQLCANANLKTCEYNVEMMNDDENIVIKNVNLPNFN